MRGIRRERPGWRKPIAVIAGVLFALCLPGIASASVALPDGVVFNGAVANDYTFTTTTGYWSVVAVQPATGDVDLRVFTSTSVLLSSSLYGVGKTDFVAINSNAGYRPLQDYRANIAVYSGSASHAVQQRQGHSVINLPVPVYDGVSGPSDPDITFAVLSNQDVVSVADIYLTAGQQFWSTTTDAGQSLYLLENNSANSTLSRAMAGNAQHTIVDGCTLYTATVSGWHGLVVVDDRMPTAPGGGIAFALHRFNPAKPTTCPVKNFPGPTPA